MQKIVLLRHGEVDIKEYKNISANQFGEWIIEYNVVGDPTVMTVNATATTDTLFNLLSDTDYEYRVRSYCGVGDSSIWSAVQTFSTPVSPSLLVPFIPYSAIVKIIVSSNKRRYL
mgnify:CR=1 FL=1